MGKENNFSITDKELLAICNLSNLKMEFANIIKEEKEENVRENGKDVKKKIYINHTIYSLLEKEINAIRERNILFKECELYKNRITDGDYENLKKIYTTQGENLNSNTKKLYYEQTKFRVNEIKYDSLVKENPEKYLGSFYNSDNKKIVYNQKETLIKKAPLLIEYFDSYEESKKDSTNEGAFLEEWEIIFGGDSYSIAEKTAEIYKKTFEKTLTLKLILISQNEVQDS